MAQTRQVSDLSKPFEIYYKLVVLLEGFLSFVVFKAFIQAHSRLVRARLEKGHGSFSFDVPIAANRAMSVFVAFRCAEY